MLRSDLMLQTSCEPSAHCETAASKAQVSATAQSSSPAYCCWKQVEINSIASGFGHLGPASGRIHRLGEAPFSWAGNFVPIFSTFLYEFLDFWPVTSSILFLYIPYAFLDLHLSRRLFWAGNFPTINQDIGYFAKIVTGGQCEIPISLQLTCSYLKYDLNTFLPARQRSAYTSQYG